MAFHEDTLIMTNSGWKKISDIGGFDKVLVRNFLGYSSLTQPLAIEKTKYDGTLCCIGNRHWNMRLTPEHKIYNNKNQTMAYREVGTIPASPLKPIVLDRTAKYLPEERYLDGKLYIYKGRTAVRRSFCAKDIYVFLAFVIQRATFYTNSRKRTNNPYRKTIRIAIDKETETEAFDILVELLDRLGVKYNYTASLRRLEISARNTLCGVIGARLGEAKKKEMSIPMDMIFKGVDRFMSPFMKLLLLLNRNYYDGLPAILGTEKMISSLEVLYSVHGIATRITNVPREKRKRLIIGGVGQEASITFHKKEPNNHRYVYAIDLLEGQVLAKGEGHGVWMSPR